MGYGPEPQALMRRLATKLPAGFSVVELGDQMITVGMRYVKGRLGARHRRFERKLARHFFQDLGCGRYETIDANGNASFLADLNLPLPAEMQSALGAFDLVTNAGTTEHVFDQAQCWETIHDLAKPGGFIFAEQPSQGYPDHGFYCLQPTFFKDIARHNDYRIEHFKVSDIARGKIARVIFQKMASLPFRTPVQGRYRKFLKV